MTEYVIYRRVSTKSQGDSGLGLDAQIRDINLFLENYSDAPYTILGEFTDIESGKCNDRPELEKAIALAKSAKATLLVAKLDRLSRRVAFIATLMEDKRLNFKVASMPHAEPFALHLYAALAEQERKFISLRTKQALAEAKAKGKVLGGLRETTKARNNIAAEAAAQRAEKLRGILETMRKGGATLAEVAEKLNAAGYTTPGGAQWHLTQVHRVLRRLKIH